jgi:YggT family protein
MNMIITLLFFLLQIFNFILLARVLMSWVPNIDRSNPLVQLIYDLTEPVLRPIREMLPPSSGMDFSPLVAFLGIYILMTMLRAF